MYFPPLTHTQLLEKVRSFDAVNYSKTRNFVNGWVSKLSPYITHGVITIEEIVRLSLERYTIDEAEMRYKELLRREYFTQVHYRNGDAIVQDMEEDKTKIPKQTLLPAEIVHKTFSSDRVNQCIAQLETTGYLHNHQRMRLASYMTHRQKLDWKKCADWTYYYFLDGELGSNHLSRQRVQSTFSHKPYYMNEENLQRYGKYTDAVYRGSYEDVEKQIFDPKRESEVVHSNDIYQLLYTDLSYIPQANNEYSWYAILTPRDLHPSKIKNPEMSICVLDTNFLIRHPRSGKRIEFVQSYCDLYGVNLVQWDIASIVSASKNITLYETRNPYYKQAYEQVMHRLDVTYHMHHRCSPLVRKMYTKKFFPFREKTVQHLYVMQRELKKL